MWCNFKFDRVRIQAELRFWKLEKKNVFLFHFWVKNITTCFFTTALFWHLRVGSIIGEVCAISLSWRVRFFCFLHSITKSRCFFDGKRLHSAAYSMSWRCMGLNTRKRVAAFLVSCVASELGVLTFRGNILQLKTDAQWRCSQIWTENQNFLQLSVIKIPFANESNQQFQLFVFQNFHWYKTRHPAVTGILCAF